MCFSHESKYTFQKCSVKKKKERKNVYNTTDIFKKSITDWYMNCLSSGNFAHSKNVCFAQIALHYYDSENEYQSNILEEDIEKENGCRTRPPKNSF